MPQIKPTLCSDNDLLERRGVWYPSTGRPGDFDYSDGDDEEQAIEEIILAAEDRSSHSKELSGPYESWAVEYHLSPDRANLLRPLQLGDRQRILEIGCGCGAITRYLGEQGFQVDAVEGSSRRAHIASLRCSDLDSVRVICADAATLSLPSDSYDAVVFVGVLEYSGVYASDNDAPEEQIRRFLKSAVRTLRPNGLVVIAIENRLGLKYLAGAPEDHLGRSWIGIADYPVSGGPQTGNEQQEDHSRSKIRTLDQARWRDLLGGLNLSSTFFYPLPDYKLPMACLSESFAASPACNQLVWRHSSVSRAGFWEPALPTRLSQAGIVLGGEFGTFSDSFGIVASPCDQAIVDDVLPYDYVDFLGESDSGSGLCKLEHENVVRYFNEDSSGSIQDKWVEGEPLEQLWLRLACADGYAGLFNGMQLFLHDLRGLFESEPERYRQAELSPAKVLNSSQKERWFPKRYGSTDEIQSPEERWRRAVLDFAVGIGPEVRRVIGAGGYRTVGEFVDKACEAVGLGSAKEKCGPVEDLEPAAGGSKHASDRAPLDGRLSVTWAGADQGDQYLRFQAYWAKPGETFSVKASVWVDYDWRSSPVLRLELPADSIGLDRLRIDPVDHRVCNAARIALLEELSIDGTFEDEKVARFIQIDLIDTEVVSHMQDIQLGTLGGRQLLHFSGPDPQIHLAMGQLGKELLGAQLVVTLKIAWPALC
ncbi:MAG: class I SAM-dependent methyltransferase [Pseudomonadota bacterium]|nr:class I SAM-dependent methyltransferase [Pseudomonadota bacterium]